MERSPFNARLVNFITSWDRTEVYCDYLNLSTKKQLPFFEEATVWLNSEWSNQNTIDISFLWYECQNLTIGVSVKHWFWIIYDVDVVLFGTAVKIMSYIKYDSRVTQKTKLANTVWQWYGWKLSLYWQYFNLVNINQFPETFVEDILSLTLQRIVEPDVEVTEASVAKHHKKVKVALQKEIDSVKSKRGLVVEQVLPERERTTTDESKALAKDQLTHCKITRYDQRFDVINIKNDKVAPWKYQGRKYWYDPNLVDCPNCKVKLSKNKDSYNKCWKCKKRKWRVNDSERFCPVPNLKAMINKNKMTLRDYVSYEFWNSQQIYRKDVFKLKIYNKIRELWQSKHSKQKGVQMPEYLRIGAEWGSVVRVELELDDILCSCRWDKNWYQRSEIEEVAIEYVGAKKQSDRFSKPKVQTDSIVDNPYHPYREKYLKNTKTYLKTSSQILWLTVEECALHFIEELSVDQELQARNSLKQTEQAIQENEELLEHERKLEEKRKNIEDDEILSEHIYRNKTWKEPAWRKNVLWDEVEASSEGAKRLSEGGE